MNMRTTILLSGVFFLGGLMGGLLFSYFHLDPDISSSRQIRQVGKYEFVNPLLECEVAEGTINARKENFYAELEVFVNELKRERDLSDVGVYFRDLNNGPAFGIHQEDGFFPASLLKVPVMMAYYKLSESYPNILEKELFFDQPQEFGVMPTILPKESLVPQTWYTVRELLRRMIVYSDNQALGLLSSHLPVGVIENLFEMLGVDEDVLRNSDGRLSVKEYAGFFRILFNSSYLSNENSEKALRLLSETVYDEAIPGKLPKDIIVSHKFGEAGTGATERQLHDCGVVYFPDHPYLICIMTRGKRTEDLKMAIAHISEFVYKKIDEQY